MSIRFNEQLIAYLLGDAKASPELERFKLTFHRETRDVPVYALTVAKRGPKLTESEAGGESEPDEGLAFDPRG